MSAFPAGAGMNRMAPCFIAEAMGVPRRRGDEPAYDKAHDIADKRSPQARG